jgi:hypothetical protein
MQSTQSGGTVFFRAVIMVGFLAVIFFAAVSGNALPDAVRKRIEKYLPATLASSSSAKTESVSPSSAANAASEAPPFNAVAGSAVLNIRPAAPALMENPSAPRPLTPDAAAAPLTLPSAAPSANGSSPVVPVNYLAQVDSPVVSPAGTPTVNTPGVVKNAILPTNSSLPLNSSAAGSPFTQIQDRLKQLGATYYLLETWGNQQQLYRFYCKMAVGGNSNYTHCFEHISSDPMQAMNEVLKQVENWRNGGATGR